MLCICVHDSGCGGKLVSNMTFLYLVGFSVGFDHFTLSRLEYESLAAERQARLDGAIEAQRVAAEEERSRADEAALQAEKVKQSEVEQEPEHYLRHREVEKEEDSAEEDLEEPLPQEHPHLRSEPPQPVGDDRHDDVEIASDASTTPLDETNVSAPTDEVREEEEEGDVEAGVEMDGEVVSTPHIPSETDEDVYESGADGDIQDYATGELSEMLLFRL